MKAVHQARSMGRKSSFLPGLGPGEVDGRWVVEVAADHDGLRGAALFLAWARNASWSFIYRPSRPSSLVPLGKVDIEEMEGGVFDAKAAFPITGIGEFAVHGERFEGGLGARRPRRPTNFLTARPAIRHSSPGAAMFAGDPRGFSLSFWEAATTHRRR